MVDNSQELERLTRIEQEYEVQQMIEADLRKKQLSLETDLKLAQSKCMKLEEANSGLNDTKTVNEEQISQLKQTIQK